MNAEQMRWSTTKEKGRRTDGETEVVKGVSWKLDSS